MVNGMGRKKVKQFSAPGSKTSSIPSENPERVRGERKQRDRRTTRSMDGGEGAEQEDTKWVKGG